MKSLRRKKSSSCRSPAIRTNTERKATTISAVIAAGCPHCGKANPYRSNNPDFSRPKQLPRSSLPGRDDFNPVDRRTLHIGGESNHQFAVGDIHIVHRYFTGALRAPGLDPDIKILEFMLPSDIERKHEIGRAHV